MRPVQGNYETYEANELPCSQILIHLYPCSISPIEAF